MLTKRTVLLAATGLLIGYVAAAQPNSSAAPDSNDFLLGLIIGLLGLVAVAVVLTGILVTTQLKHRRQSGAEAPATAISQTKERGISPC